MAVNFARVRGEFDLGPIAGLIWVGLATARIVKARECPLGVVIIDLGRG
jgi:hypothetical protein